MEHVMHDEPVRTGPQWVLDRRRFLLAAGLTGLGVAGVSVIGAGTALVYPTLIAAISDAVTPVARAPVVGVYRFWRDAGYALGALIAGAVADALGYGGAIAVVAGLTAASGLWVLRDMPADRRGRDPAAGARGTSPVEGTPTRHAPADPRAGDPSAGSLSRRGR
ncbi:MAG: MFS transporter [Actinobacteria bacterium]|nr:MFS transporter [Actinomycetota bacterium]